MGVMDILFEGDPPRASDLTEQTLTQRVLAAYPDAQVHVHDLTGGGDHFQMEVTCAAFAGVSPVKRHRMIYGLFDDVLGKQLHALALTCLVPDKTP